MREFECQISGLDEIENKLLELLPKEARTALRRGLRTSGEFMRGKISDAAPVGETGNLKKDITQKVSTSTRNDEGVVSVGPSKSAYYAMWVEFGSIHNVPPNPFIRRTFEQEGQGMLAAFTEQMREGLKL